MIIQTIKFKSKFSEEEILNIAKEREPKFQSIPGLVQKYYVRYPEKGYYGGVYIWDSMDALNAYRASGLATSIPQAYGVLGVPQVDTMDMLFHLKEDLTKA